MTTQTTAPEAMLCRYCNLGIGAGGRVIPFHNLASLHQHEVRCKENPRANPQTTPQKPKLVVRESQLSKGNLFFVVTKDDHKRYAECWSEEAAFEIADAVNEVRGHE